MLTNLGRLHLVGWKGAWNTRQRGIAAWSRSIVDGRNPANQLRLVVYPIIYRVLYVSGGAGFLPSTVWWMWRWMNFLAVTRYSMSLLFQSPEETGHIPLAWETLSFSVAVFQYGWSTILFFLWRSVATSCCLPSRRWTPGFVSDWVVVGDVPLDSRDKKNLHGYSFCISTWKIQQFLISFIMPCGSRIYTRPAITKADGPPQRRALT